MRKAAEHHMRHLSELGVNRLSYVWMVVPVAGGPPAGNAIDQFAPVGQDDTGALCTNDGQWRRYSFHLGIG